MKTVCHLGFRYGFQAGRVPEQREAGDYAQRDRGKAGFSFSSSHLRPVRGYSDEIREMGLGQKKYWVSSAERPTNDFGTNSASVRPNASLVGAPLAMQKTNAQKPNARGSRLENPDLCTV